MWGKTGVDFVTNVGRKAMSAEITPLAILATDGVGKGSLGMVTTFCHSHQAKLEPLDALLTLVQPDSHEPSTVVVKVFTILPYPPWGSFGPLT